MRRGSCRVRQEKTKLSRCFQWLPASPRFLARHDLTTIYSIGHAAHMHAFVPLAGAVAAAGVTPSHRSVDTAGISRRAPPRPGRLKAGRLYLEEQLSSARAWSSSTTDQLQRLRVCSPRRIDVCLRSSNRDFYEERLHRTAYLNEFRGRSDSYVLKFSYKKMWEMKADVDLIRSICNSRTNIDHWLLPVVQQFVRKFLSDNGFAIEESAINGTRLVFSGLFPERMQMFKDFRKRFPLVQHVPIIGRKTSILAPTPHGCHCMEILMVGILANHSHDISWGGDFSEESILIIEWKSKSHQVTTRDSSHYEMKILQKPVDGNGQSLREAMVRDLCKISEIIIPFYRVDGDFPVHFLDLKKELEGAEEDFVDEKWYRKYLTHHPAIMPSAGRRTFLTYLHHALLDCNKPLGNIMGAKPTAYPDDWKTVVELEMRGKKRGDRHTITVLQNVYYYNKKPGTEYGSSQRDLIRFMRNVHEHGKEHDASVVCGCELELYLAKMFNSFLPSILSILLKSGEINHLEEAWSYYEVSKLLNLNGSMVKEDTNGNIRLYYV